MLNEEELTIDCRNFTNAAFSAKPALTRQPCSADVYFRHLTLQLGKLFPPSNVHLESFCFLGARCNNAKNTSNSDCVTIFLQEFVQQRLHYILVIAVRCIPNQLTVSLSHIPRKKSSFLNGELCNLVSEISCIISV